MSRFSNAYLRVLWPRASRDGQPVDFSVAILAYRLAVLVERAYDRAASAWVAWRRKRRRCAAVWELFRLNDRLLSDMGLDRGRMQAYIDGLENDPTLKSRSQANGWVPDLKLDTRHAVAGLPRNDDTASNTA